MVFWDIETINTDVQGRTYTIVIKTTPGVSSIRRQVSSTRQTSEFVKRSFPHLSSWRRRHFKRMSVNVLPWICAILRLCLASLNAKYDIFQDASRVGTDFKIHMGLHYIDPYFTGVRINQTSLNNQGLTRAWNLQGSFENGFTYLVKTFHEDVYVNKPVKVLYLLSLEFSFGYVCGTPWCLQAVYCILRYYLF